MFQSQLQYLELITFYPCACYDIAIKMLATAVPAVNRMGLLVLIMEALIL